MPMLDSENALNQCVWRLVHETPAIDAYTYLRDLRFCDHDFAWGLDDLLTSAPLMAELFRAETVSTTDILNDVAAPFSRENFAALEKAQRAEMVWQRLFRERSPLSEATRGVLTVLGLLGINPQTRDLADYREIFAAYELRQHVRRVFKIANLRAVVMNNDPLAEDEQAVWHNDPTRDQPFLSSLCLDSLLAWEIAQPILTRQGYIVADENTPEFDRSTYDGIQKFLDNWLQKTNAIYFSLSVNGGFNLFTKKSETMRFARKCLLPFCAKRHLPIALIINAQYESDSVGTAANTKAITSVEEMCANFPDNRFLVAAVSPTNQRLLLRAAGRFPNLMAFGGAWNTPGTMYETAKVGLELLGDNFIPHYSGAETLEQLLYKWAHARWTLGKTLQQQYLDLHRTGWRLTEAEIARDVFNLLQGNFLKFVKVEAARETAPEPEEEEN